MFKQTLLCLLICLGLGQIACNPKCEESPGIPAIVKVTETIAGGEVLIETDPVALIQQSSRQIYVKDDGGNPKQLSKTNIANLGAKVKLPDGMTGPLTLYTDEPDCEGLVPLTNVEAFDASHFVNNANFIAPITPTLFFPTLPSAPVIDITNAWISPNDRAYCLWFGEFQRTYRADDSGNPLDGDPSTPEKIDTIFFDSKFLDEKSIELGIGACGTDVSLYQENPVSGVVDFENNFIRIFIDRTANPRVGKVEEYEGFFVDASQVQNVDYLRTGTCLANPSEPPRSHLMVLTSRLTGHQMFLFKLEE